mmetsp:Transcript_60846/g.72231  ORF Transcript_60846/g.72231 Transcript_60846/m.72231 type:complete len:238 (-) Transcript_60846:985-1698(-)
MPVFNCCFEGTHHCEGIIAITVQNGTVECLPQITSIRRTPGMNWISRKSNLIIYNNMNSPPHIEILHTRQLHSLINHPLPCKSSIAMQQYRHNIPSILLTITTIILLRTGLASHHRIDAFQMRRIRHETQVNAPPIRISPIHATSQMILYIPRQTPRVHTLRILLHVIMSPLKLTKNQRHRLPHHVRQHIQPPPMRHTNNKTMRPQLRRPVHTRLQRRDDRLPAVQTEPFRRVEFIR